MRRSWPAATGQSPVFVKGEPDRDEGPSSFAKDAFGERAERSGQLLVPATIAVLNAQILPRTQPLASNLRVTLTNQW